MTERLGIIAVVLLVFGGVVVATATPSAAAAPAANPWPHQVVNGFSTPSGNGFWLVYADGSVTATGDAQLFGDASNLALNGPLVGAAATTDGLGYWLVGNDGGIFTYGNGQFFGSMGGQRLNQPVFSMSPTGSGNGYWLVARDGGIFTFGDAVFYGSMGGTPLNQPINGITTSPSGNGYRMVARDGGIFSFGDAPFYGSLPGMGIHVADVVGMAPTPTNKGYWIVRSNGNTHAFGDAEYFGNYAASALDPVSAIFANPKAQGYVLVTLSGRTVPFGSSPGASPPPPPPPPAAAATTVSIGDATVAEGNAGAVNAVFPVTLSAATAHAVTVDFATLEALATAPPDYNQTMDTLTFAPGVTSTSVTVTINGDALPEPDETFYVQLENAAGATIADAFGRGTIVDDDVAVPSLSVTSPSATNEGNAGTTNFVFTVTLSAISTNTVTVDYTTVDGSASAPSDYTAQSGTLTYAPGQTSQQIAVSVKGDTLNETNETFTVNLSNPTNATVAGTGIGTGTITNDDTPPTLTIAAPSATNEGNAGTTNFVFTVTLSAISTNTVTVDYTTVDGSASAPSDYTAQSGTLTYAPGQTSQQIAVSVKGDTLNETNETFTVNLSNPTNATVAGTGIGTGTITNDDTPPTLTIAAPSATNEGNAGTTNFVFTVTLSAISTNTVTVDYTTVDGSASAPSDYTAQSGTLTYAPGQTSEQIAVSVKGDTLNETNETFTVNLSNPTNATVAGTGIGTGTITNDDTPPTLTISSPAAVTEGNAGTTVNAVFTVTLSAISASTVTVDYTTVDGSASAPTTDYFAQSGTLTYAPGQTSQQIAVLVKGDTLNETNETFTVNLSNPTNATIAGTGIGTETINNDDAVPTLSITNVSQLEGTGGATNFVFTVTLSTASGLPVSVDFATANGAAVAPGDYASQTGTLTFTPGLATQTITVAVAADAVNEANETFTVVLSNSTNATIAGGTGTGTIQNDD